VQRSATTDRTLVMSRSAVRVRSSALYFLCRFAGKTQSDAMVPASPLGNCRVAANRECHIPRTAHGEVPRIPLLRCYTVNLVFVRCSYLKILGSLAPSLPKGTLKRKERSDSIRSMASVRTSAHIYAATRHGVGEAQSRTSPRVLTRHPTGRGYAGCCIRLRRIYLPRTRVNEG
jgi:hypothetical protein